jgi:hypothetical protein
MIPGGWATRHAIRWWGRLRRPHADFCIARNAVTSIIAIQSVELDEEEKHALGVLLLDETTENVRSLGGLFRPV